LAEFLDAWEAKHGELTAEELARATAEIGLASEPRIGPVRAARGAVDPNQAWAPTADGPEQLSA